MHEGMHALVHTAKEITLSSCFFLILVAFWIPCITCLSYGSEDKVLLHWNFSYYELLMIYFAISLELFTLLYFILLFSGKLVALIRHKPGMH